MRSAGILLAAGAGVRFGGGKLLARMPDGKTVGYRSCANLMKVVPEVIAVVRPGDDDLAHALRSAGARVTFCAGARQGMGASLAHGVREAGDADAYIVALADMPWIAADTIRAVAERVAQGASLVIPRYGRKRGHPVGFGAVHRETLLALTGDAGARSIIGDAQAAGAIDWLDVDDAGIVRDIDIPADLPRPR